MSALAVVQLRSLGAAYTLSNAVFRNTELKHLETCPMNGQALVLFQGSPTNILHAVAQISSNEVIASSLIPEARPELLQAYYSLSNCNPLKFLIIIESELAGPLFESAQLLLQQDLKIMDFRIPRAMGSRAHAILTGEHLPDVVVQELKDQGLQVTVVNEISENFRRFLSLEPKI